MGVLDDLEAALAYTFEKVNLPEKAHIVVRVSDVVQVIAVCRAAVAYRETEKAYRGPTAGFPESVAEDHGKFDALMSAEQALLAATEGLT